MLYAELEQEIHFDHGCKLIFISQVKTITNKNEQGASENNGTFS